MTILFDDGYGLFDSASGDFDDAGVINATASVSGVTTTSGFGSVSANGTGNAIVSNVALSTTLGNVSASGIQSPTASVNNVSGIISANTITASGTESRTASVSGIALISTAGEALGIGDGSAIASVSSASTTSSARSIGATGTIEGITGSKKSKKKLQQFFLPFNPVAITLETNKDARISVVGATVYANVGKCEATSTVSISAKAKIYSIGTKSDVELLKARGIKNPTDDELIWLLAA